MLESKELEPEKLEVAANMLKAMAHPMRIAILKHLEGGKRLTVLKSMNYWELNNLRHHTIWGY